MSSTVEDLIRGYYRAYETDDRAAVEAFLSPDFTFTSPLDDRIDRATYFVKCWPGHERIRAFHLAQLLVDADHALVRYDAVNNDGTGFQNVEHFVLDGHRATHIDVYFGR
jgi:ketosteroid isomerase-like protein